MRVPISAQVLSDESGFWELDLSRHELRSRGVAVPIGGRALEIFAILAESAGELVAKDVLMSRVWPGAIVEENTLQAHISAIRRILGADGPKLQTVSGRGYRLTGAWSRARAPVFVEPSGKVPAAAATARRSNLPASVTRLLGRSFAASSLVSLLAAHRLVTLTGPGGIGKTALALDVARTVFDEAKGDVYLVDLASVSDPALVTSAVAGVTDVRLGSNDTNAASVAQALGARQILLLLDNCEHVIEAAAETAETIIQMCAGVSILATSRESLRISGEHVYRVGPLSFPMEEDQEPDAILGQSAVQLFMSRINALDMSFLPDAGMLTSIAAVCRQLDGIPLAIEFAAARAATLGLSQVAARLDDRFGLLTAGRRTALPRHQTLRATLDWSYDLLPEWERQLLCRSAIFPAGFTEEGARVVTGDLDRPASAVLDGISNLVAKSLVVSDGSTSSGRWRQLETIRAYAIEKLVESGEIHHVTRLAAQFLRDRFKARAHRAPAGENAETGTDDRRDIDNVRWAIEWALSSAGALPIGLELTASSAPLWFRLSLMFEYRQRVERALNRLEDLPAPDPRLEMRLWSALGHALWYSGPDTDPPRMKRAFERAQHLAELTGDSDTLLQALWGSWAVARGSGEHELAATAAERYAAIAQTAGANRDRVLGDRMLALTRHDLGNHVQAERHARAVIDQAHVLDTASNTDLQVDAHIAMLTLLARVQWLQGLPDQSNATVQRALDAALRMDHWFSICYVLFMAGCPVSLWTGDLREAELRIDMLKERTGGNPGFTRHARIFADALRLRQGNETDRLRAAYFEPRIQYVTMAEVSELIRQPAAVPPGPDVLPCEAPWSLPEILRVDAEIDLWREGRSAHQRAEAKLLRAIALAGEHQALSWELRAAISLARLHSAQGRTAEAKALLRRVYGRFSEGFETEDLRAAAALIETL